MIGAEPGRASQPASHKTQANSARPVHSLKEGNTLAAMIWPIQATVSGNLQVLLCVAQTVQIWNSGFEILRAICSMPHPSAIFQGHGRLHASPRIHFSACNFKEESKPHLLVLVQPCQLASLVHAQQLQHEGSVVLVIDQVLLAGARVSGQS